MAVAYSELKELTEAVNALNVKLDERVRAVEEWQRKNEEKISQGGAIPAEGKAALDTINAEISQRIAEYKDLVQQQKEAKLAEQRPGYAGLGRKGGKPA